jgi:hypothetical protein
MKFSMIRGSLVTSLLASLLLIPAIGRADAAEDAERVGTARLAAVRFASVCIVNTTENPINYDVQWGDGPWESYTVEALASRWHSWRYDSPDIAVSPELSIDFDSDMYEGESWLTYSLDKFATTEEGCDGAWTYEFQWDGPSSRYIDLVSID